MTSPEFLALQQVLAGRYSLESELGRGGMGIVYLARDAALERPVAIKLLPPDMAKDAELKERFLREARTAAQLSHPNIVAIHLVEDRDGMVYFVMAYIEGESLGELVKRSGPMRHSDAVRVIQETAWALAYAHGRGVVHRDVKPDNIMIERATGRALVTDFGIARSATAPALTSKGLILGTIQYMAPEQADPDATIDGRADLYALGVTAFYALTGRLPFESTSITALMAAHMMEPAPPISTVAPAVPAKLAEAVDRCLAKDPAARWPNGEALAAAIADAAPASRPMPPSIRAFTIALSSGTAQLFTVVGVTYITMKMAPESAGVLGWVLGVIALGPIANIVFSSRAVTIAGFGHADVIDAMALEIVARDRYTDYEEAQNRLTLAQIQRGWVRVAMGVIGGLMVFASVMGVIELIQEQQPLSKALIGGAFTVFMGVFGIELVKISVGLVRARDRALTFMDSSLKRRERIQRSFWGSRPVKWILALGRMTVRNAPQLLDRPPANAPTAVLIAKAAGDVFEGLPDAERKTLGAVPEVLKRLEGAAAILRARRGKLEEALAAVGEAGAGSKREAVAADLEAERAAIDARLKTALEAMENLRLDLLKLRAGIGSTDDLTEAIAAARRIGEEVNIVVGARGEVSSIA